MSRTKKEPVKVEERFAISVPMGTERVIIKKHVMLQLLQKYCNLPLLDFEITTEGNGEKVEFVFAEEKQ